jgi:hypothetical protein
MDHRLYVWQKLAGGWRFPKFLELHNEIGLSELNENIGLILKGKQKGRVLVNLDRE